MEKIQTDNKRGRGTSQPGECMAETDCPTDERPNRGMCSARKQTLNIGAVTVLRTAALAPMAGVADRAMREVCRSMGACYAVSEMVSAKGFTRDSGRSAALLDVADEPHPVAAQLFGDDPEILAQAAKQALAYGPDLIDLNMGCPAPKIAGNGGGSALMRVPELAERIVRAVVNAVDLPVTVKFRKGWDDNQVNAVEFAQMCEQAGAAAITIHGRTRMQMYAPPADWDIIAAVKRAVSIPVIGNGDVTDASTAAAMYEQTGVDLVMVGRGALGKPWVFGEIAAYLETGQIPPPPSPEERMELMLRQARLACLYKGEAHALREFRKHAAWYCAGVHGAAALRRQAGMLSVWADLEQLAAQYVSACEREAQ